MDPIHMEPGANPVTAVPYAFATCYWFGINTIETYV